MGDSHLAGRSEELQRALAEVERLRSAVEGLQRAAESDRLRIEQLREALRDLLDRQHDYPTDLSHDHEWFSAYERARQEVDDHA